jgi:hypothetical protein
MRGVLSCGDGIPWDGSFIDVFNDEVLIRRIMLGFSLAGHFLVWEALDSATARLYTVWAPACYTWINTCMLVG